MPEIRDIKPPGPAWQRRRIEEDGPRPDQRRNQRDRREPKPGQDRDRPQEGQIDEYA
jgi:hypothetical protein